MRAGVGGGAAGGGSVLLSQGVAVAEISALDLFLLGADMCCRHLKSAY